MPKVLVTGASGFVGRYLLDELRENGREVICLSTGRHSDTDNCQWVQTDLRDTDAISRVIKAHKPDQIYHLAAISNPAGNSVREYYQTNVLGTLNVLEPAAETNADILVVGSAYAYGQYSKKIVEDCALNPVNPYGASKAAQDSLAGSFSFGENKVIRVRPFNHTGPGQSNFYLVPGLIERIQKFKSNGNDDSNELPIGNVDAVRDFMDVRDVVKIYRLLLDKTEQSGVFNVCSGKGYSVKELFEVCCEKIGVSLLYKENEGLLRKQDIATLVGDERKLQSIIDWAPRYLLPETIDTMIDQLTNTGETR